MLRDHDVEAGFTIKSGYGYLAEFNRKYEFELEGIKVTDNVWNSYISYRIKAFLWRCIINRILTKDQLFVGGRISSISDLRCVFSNNSDKSLDHLILYCPITKEIWGIISDWVEVEMGKKGCCVVEFSSITDKFQEEKGKERFRRDFLDCCLSEHLN